MTDPPRRPTSTTAPPSTPRPNARADAASAAAEIGIGDLAREFAISTRAIRFYETRGLIAPERRGASRIFRATDRRRLALIVRAKNLGLSLEEIGEHLALFEYEQASEAALTALKERADRHIALLCGKRADLGETLTELRRVRQAVAARLTRTRKARQTDR